MDYFLRYPDVKQQKIDKLHITRRLSLVQNLLWGTELFLDSLIAMDASFDLSSFGRITDERRPVSSILCDLQRQDPYLDVILNLRRVQLKWFNWNFHNIGRLTIIISQTSIEKSINSPRTHLFFQSRRTLRVN